MCCDVTSHAVFSGVARVPSLQTSCLYLDGKDDRLVNAAESELAEQECIQAKHHKAFSSPVQSCYPFCYSCQSGEGIQLLATKPLSDLKNAYVEPA